MKHPELEPAFTQEGPHFIDPQALHRAQPLDRRRGKQRHMPGPGLGRQAGRPGEDLVPCSMDTLDARLVRHLLERRAQGVAAHLQRLAERTLARQPVAPLAGRDLGGQVGDGLGNEGLPLGKGMHRHAVTLGGPPAKSSRKVIAPRGGNPLPEQFRDLASGPFCNRLHALRRGPAVGPAQSGGESGEPPSGHGRRLVRRHVAQAVDRDDGSDRRLPKGQDPPTKRASLVRSLQALAHTSVAPPRD
jgi:hypothetical protein